MEPSKNKVKSDVYVPITNYGRSTANGQRVYPNPDLDRQYRDNVAWMDNNLGEGMDFVWIEDDGYRDSTPAPGLKEAVAETRTKGPGILVVESLDRICSSDRAALLIVAEIISNGWRFVACKDGIDTAKDENWRQVIKPLVAITYERSPARSFDVLQQRERNVDWLYQNVARTVDITGFLDNGYTGVIAVLKVPEFSRFESAVFFAWVFFPSRTQNRLLRPFLAVLRPVRRQKALSDRPISSTFKPAGLRTFHGGVDTQAKILALGLSKPWRKVAGTTRAYSSSKASLRSLRRTGQFSKLLPTSWPAAGVSGGRRLSERSERRLDQRDESVRDGHADQARASVKSDGLAWPMGGSRACPQTAGSDHPGHGQHGQRDVWPAGRLGLQRLLRL